MEIFAVWTYEMIAFFFSLCYYIYNKVRGTRGYVTQKGELCSRREKILLSNIPEAAKENILYRNAVREFGCFRKAAIYNVVREKPSARAGSSKKGEMPIQKFRRCYIRYHTSDGRGWD